MNRRTLVAVVLSGIFPGLGQLYNRQWIKAVVFLVAGLALTWFLARALPADLEALVAAPPDRSVLIVAVVLLAVWLWSVVDAGRWA
jgi:hypothetical protein